MKKYIRDIIIFVFIVFMGCNMILNYRARPMVTEFSPGTGYLFIFSAIPDRVTFVGFNLGNMSAPLLTVDFDLASLLTGDYARSVDGITATGIKLKFVKKKNKKKGSGGKKFVIPFCRYLKIRGGKIIYEDPEQGVSFRINGIKGASRYKKASKKTEEKMVLNCEGHIMGRENDTAGLKMYFHPYHRNRFSCNIFGTKIRADVFEPLFKKYKLKVESGIMNFLLQIKGKDRKVYVNNYMELKNLKIKEDIGPDLKALFNVSYEQLGNYLTDSNGNLYVAFDFTLDDSEFLDLPRIYAEKFADDVGGRIKAGVMTAPVRGVVGLIWNLTGENIFRIFNLFGGE